METKTSPSEYRFYAFISYSRKNEVWASWLQKKLELYRLPSVLQKQYPQIPKPLKIFRDKTDISVGGTVEHALAKELRVSKKLIVICSPDSAKSDYVEYEIASFLKLGHDTTDILPLVVEGVLCPDAENHCYTPLLTNLNLNAADAVQEGKSNAFIRLLASLLEINYDDLKQREKKRKIRRTFFAGSAAFLFASFCAVALWYFSPHTRYYADYVTYWEIPEGIKNSELSKNEAKKRPFHYEITTRCARPIKIVYANSCGLPLPQCESDRENRAGTTFYFYENPYFPTKNKQKWNLSSALCTYYDNDVEADIQKSCSMRIEYTRESETVLSADFYYAAEHNIEKSLFNDVLCETCLSFSDVSESENPESIDFKTPEQEFFENGSAMYRYKIECDEMGRAKRVTFYNKNNHRVSDKNGIFGFENAYDEQDRLSEQTYLYSESERLSVSKKRIEYDSYLVSGVSFFTQTGEPVQNVVRGYASLKTKWSEDEDGLFSVQTEFFDAAGTAVNARKPNCASIQCFFDESGFKTQQVTQKTKKQAANLPAFVKQFHEKEKEPVLKTVFTNNANGQPVQIQKFTDDDLKKTTRIVYDKTGIIKTKEHFDARDELMATVDYSYQEKSPATYHHISKKQKNMTVLYDYDSCGRLLSQSQISSGEMHTVTKIAYYGGNKIISHYKNGAYANKDGFAVAQFSYTNDGMLYFVQFFDETGNKARSSLLRFSEYTALYTPNSLLVSESFKNQDGILTAPNDYALYEAQQNLEDTILLQGAYFMADKSLAKRKRIVRFDSEKNQNGELKIRYYDGADTILNEKIYANGSMED